LKGVGFDPSNGFESPDSAGLPDEVTGSIQVTRFNDPQLLEDQFERLGDRIACLTVEPVMGSGGFLPADPEYLKAARELTHRHGALLVFDEIISGFRFRAGDAGALYGVRPDLATFGKIMGGGMPVCAVGGRAEVMKLLERDNSRFVRFSGGTYSAHPAALHAACACMRYLTSHEDEIYPSIGKLGRSARQILEESFRSEGIQARCTGYPNEAVRGSSLGMVVFPCDPENPLRRPEDVHDPERCDTVLAGEPLQLAFLLNGVHVVHGFGSVSASHTGEDLEEFRQAALKVARLLRRHVR
jgi:glutamate-1-semialdehyde 2,1-aminomutase